MTKKTTPDLMRVALTKKWNVVHNVHGEHEKILTLQNYIIRRLFLGNFRQLVHAYKHMFPSLKYMIKKYQNKDITFLIKQGKKIVESNFRAEAYSVNITYSNDKFNIVVLAKKPNLLIGVEGVMLKEIVIFLSSLLGVAKDNVNLVIQENNDPHPLFFARRAARGLANRMAFKKVVDDLFRVIKEYRSVDGFHITLSGKLNGAAIARVEKFRHGVIPKSSLNRTVVSCNEDAYTVYGVIGIKIILSIKNNSVPQQSDVVKNKKDKYISN